MSLPQEGYMAHQVITAGALVIGTATVTLDGVSMTWSDSVDLPEDTVWGDTYKQRLIGLRDYSGSFEALGDNTDNELDEDLDAVLGTSVAITWRSSSGGIAATNPEFQFTGAISNLTKTFAHGQVYKVSGTIMQTTTAAVTRDVVA